jgi:tetratricopeptide (TPR) repeat protein
MVCIGAALLCSGCGKGPVEKGQLCVALGDYGMAIHFFEKAVHTHPGSYRARYGLGKALLQKAAYNNNDTLTWRKALIQLEAARNCSPTREVNEVLSAAWTHYGRWRMNDAHDYRDSIAALRHISRAIDYHSGNAEAVNLAGIVYYNLGEIDKAVALFEKAMRIDSSAPEGFFNAGMVAWQQGSVAQAHTYWLQALKQAPEDQDILYWFARAEKRMRQERTQ